MAEGLRIAAAVQVRLQEIIEGRPQPVQFLSSVTALASLAGFLLFYIISLPFVKCRFMAACTAKQAISYIRDRLHPVAAIDAVRAAKLVAALDGDDFNERKQAVTELRQLGELAMPALREPSDKGRYAPILRRVLEKMESQYPTSDQVHECRVLTVLGRIGGEEARKLLTELADGAPEAILTRQAKATLENLPDAAPTAPASSAGHRSVP